MTYISSEAQTSAGILLRLRGRIASTVYYRRYFHNVAVIIQVTRDAANEKIIARIVYRCFPGGGRNYGSRKGVREE
jgi:hypothetical protein